MLSGRLAWVTGGGRGIGQSVSQILAREGARVVVSDLSIESCQETLQVRHDVLIFDPFLRTHSYMLDLKLHI